MFVLFCALLAAVNPRALEDDEGFETAKIVFAEDYSGAFEEAAARNVPVVLMDFDYWGPERNVIDIPILSDKSFIKAVQDAVIIVAGQVSHGTKTQIVNGRKKQVCSAWGGVSCEVHMRMLHEIFKDFAEDGELKSPLCVVLTPDQEVIGKYFEEAGFDKLMPALEKAKRKLGRGLTSTEYRQRLDTLDVITRAINAQEYRRAYQLLTEVDPLPSRFSVQRDLNDQLRRLLDIGEELLHSAEQQWQEGNHAAALKGFANVDYVFGKSDLGREAAARFREFGRTESGKPHVEEIENDIEARTLFDEGVNSERKGDYRRATYSFRRLIKKYPETLWAQKATPYLELLEDR